MVLGLRGDSVLYFHISMNFTNTAIYLCSRIKRLEVAAGDDDDDKRNPRKFKTKLKE